MGYTAAAWLSFGEAIAAIAGALTGLLFVALSVKGNALAASRSLSSKRTPQERPGGRALSQEP